MPNGVLYEVYVTYAECTDGPSVAHINMTLEGWGSVFWMGWQVYIKVRTVCGLGVSQWERLEGNVYFDVEEYQENRPNWERRREKSSL